MLCVLVLGKALIVSGQEIEWSIWTPLALLWQDLALVCVFAVFEQLSRSRALVRTVYWFVMVYVALNVPLSRLLATPLTWPMLRATRGTLADSIFHHVDWISLGMIALVLGAAVLLPVALQYLSVQPARRCFCGVVAAAALAGWCSRHRVDTRGLERNPIVTLVSTAGSRVSPSPGETDGRRTSAAAGSPLAQWRGRANGRNVVLILLESAGAQYLKSYGASADPTPNLTRLARHSLLFEKAYAVYPESIKGLFSILCSRYPAMDAPPEMHRGVGSPSLAEMLRGVGYRTALFHSGRFMYLGMEEVIRNRGFEGLYDAGDIGGEHESSFGVEEPATVARMLEWLARLPSDQPFFLTYLPIAGHHPYFTPEPRPFADDTDRNRYLNALHYADQSLGELIEGMRRLGKDENSVFVICGDHGEAFGQHPGNFGHTLFIYEENVQVPFLVMAPGLIEREVRSTQIASLIDIGPTVLDLLGLPIPSACQGVSLLQIQPNMALFFTDYSLGLLGLRQDRWKFIYEVESARSKLFDLAEDPEEKRNVDYRYPARSRAYREHLRGWIASQNYAVLSEATRASGPSRRAAGFASHFRPGADERRLRDEKPVSRDP